MMLRVLPLLVLGLVAVGCSGNMGMYQYGDSCEVGSVSGLIGKDDSSCMTCASNAAPSLEGGPGCSGQDNGIYCCD
ncbi:MAG: hypothetical protein ACLQVI_23450 [Polyangiaceae bacterium]|jgi:hypothetical protein